MPVPGGSSIPGGCEVLFSQAGRLIGATSLRRSIQDGESVQTIHDTGDGILAGLFPWKIWKARREQRENFYRQRRELLQADAEFLATEGDAPGSQRALRLLIRRIIAGDCGLPAESLHADDNTSELDKLFGQACVSDFLLAIPEGPDWSVLFSELEYSAARTLGMKIRVTASVRNAAISRWQKGESLSAWTAWLAKSILGGPKDS